jgi:hypothetical protein
VASLSIGLVGRGGIVFSYQPCKPFLLFLETRIRAFNVFPEYAKCCPSTSRMMRTALAPWHTSRLPRATNQSNKQSAFEEHEQSRSPPPKTHPSLLFVMLTCCAPSPRAQDFKTPGLRSLNSLRSGSRHSRPLSSLRPCCRERAGDDRVVCTNAIPHELRWG